VQALADARDVAEAANRLGARLVWRAPGCDELRDPHLEVKA
jgi:hypothetical protein